MYGHSTGDLVLKTIGARLRAAIRQTDTAARLAGDEFAILLDDLRHDEALHRIASGLIASIAEPIITADGRHICVSGSVGIAQSNGNETVAALMGAADAAMYEAKRSGKNRYALALAPTSALLKRPSTNSETLVTSRPTSLAPT